MNDVDEVFDAIQLALEPGEGDSLQKAAFDLESVLMYGDGTTAQEVVDRVAGILATDRFRHAVGAWRVLFALRDDFTKVPEPQLRRLFDAMLDAYEAFTDPMSCFTVSELMEHFATAWAVRSLRARLMASREDARVYVPHAFEHIARAAVDASVARDATAAIRVFLEDASARVRDEARLSLHRVQRTASEARPRRRPP